MPKLEDILVQVTVDGLDENGRKVRRPLEEWGVQKMKNTKKISAYIEAETGKSFRIRIQPKIPFPSKDGPGVHEYNTRQKTKARENGLETLRPGFSGARHKSYNSDVSVKIKKEPMEEPMALSFQATSSERMIKRIPPPPFHLLASLYLDGREKPERRVIIYLDPDDADFSYPGGEVEINGRWAQGKDGNIKEQSWVFQDIGIETLFDKMLIAGDNSDTPISERNEAELTNAFDNIYLDGDGDFVREEKSKVGQILVTIERVKLGEKWRDTNFRAKHMEHEMENVDMVDAGKEITHTTGFAHKKTVSHKSEGIRVVAFTKYKGSEGNFATFQFFYRSKSILQKFDFLGLPKTSPRALRDKSTNMAFKTPLSITFSKEKVMACNKEKRKIVGKGLFSGPAFRLKLYGENGQAVKRELPDATSQDKVKVEPLSPCSLPPGGYFNPPSPPALKLDSHDRARYSLRSFANTNRLSLKAPVHHISFDSKGLETLSCCTSLYPTPVVCITRSSYINDGSLESTSEAGEKTSSTLCSFSLLDNTVRNTGNSIFEADDEQEVSDAELHLDSDRDQGDGRTCQNKDDQGLSIGVKNLVIGKRRRGDDSEEAGTKAKKLALER